jgi:hypothetical protein
MAQFITALTNLALAYVLLVVGEATAAEWVPGRNIVDIGCHAGDGTCFVTLSGAPFGANEGCSQGSLFNQFRFDNADTSDGRRTYASMLTAFTAGRKVSVYISGCSVQGVPSLGYFSISAP